MEYNAAVSKTPKTSPEIRNAFLDFFAQRGHERMASGPLVPAKDLKGFREWLRTAGDKATYGSPGAGTVPHFIGVLAGRSAGIDLRHVPYRGSAPGIQDLLGGQVQAAIGTMASLEQHVKAGKLRALAIASDNPDVGEVREELDAESSGKYD